jgi:hypothetical protein
MNTPNYAIPGLMPPGSPKADEINLANDDGGLYLTVYKEAIVHDIKTFTFIMVDETGKIQLEDSTGVKTSHRLLGNQRVYTLILPPGSIRVGANFLAVYRNGKPFRCFVVTRKANTFSTWITQNSFQNTETSAQEVSSPFGISLTNITTQAPATLSSPGTKGQVAIKGNYVYLCVATNSWVRFPVTKW